MLICSQKDAFFYINSSKSTALDKALLADVNGDHCVFAAFYSEGEALAAIDMNHLIKFKGRLLTIERSRSSSSIGSTQVLPRPIPAGYP